MLGGAVGRHLASPPKKGAEAGLKARIAGETPALPVRPHAAGLPVRHSCRQPTFGAPTTKDGNFMP